ncbi:MAG: bi-domain-containing oxidoreductase [Nanoarchaeota archaeon]
MKQLCRDRAGNVIIEEVPLPQIEKGKILVQTLYSLISSGTELHSLATTQSSYSKTLRNPKMLMRVVKKVASRNLKTMYTNFRGKLDEVAAMGYSCVGVVLDTSSDVASVQKGDIVAAMGPDHAMHAEVICVPENLTIKVPSSVDPRHAAFTTLGCIALHAVRNTRTQLGDTVLVVGLGLIGQLVCRLLKAQGVRVIGADVIKEKLATAKKAGIEKTILLKVDSPFAGEVLRATEERGCDSIILCSTENSLFLMEQLGLSCRDRGRVVIVGNVDLTIPYSIFYRRELEVLISRSTGPGRYDNAFELKNINYPIGYVPWTEKRNAEEFLHLLSTGSLTLADLISKEFPLKQGSGAFDLLKTGKFYGILLSYQTKSSSPLVKTVKLRQPVLRKNVFCVGVAGLGVFTKNVQLPILTQLKDYHLRAVCSRTPLQAKNIARQFHADYCTSDFLSLLADLHIDLVFIATKNNLHAPLTIQAAQAKKNVFLEKPMAMNENELKEMIREIKKNNIFFTLGLNRRFSPLAKMAKESLQDRAHPLMIIYRFNDENKAERAWVDQDEGGGRILHLANHMVDVCTWLIGAEPTTVMTQSTSQGKITDQSNVSLQTTFADGSLATMIYTALGNSFLSRERIEIYWDGKIVVLDNYQTIAFYGFDRAPVELSEPDKGYRFQLQALAKKLRGEEAETISLLDAVRSSVFCFRALDSLREKQPVSLNHLAYLSS